MKRFVRFRLSHALLIVTFACVVFAAMRIWLEMSKRKLLHDVERQTLVLIHTHRHSRVMRRPGTETADAVKVLEIEDFDIMKEVFEHPDECYNVLRPGQAAFRRVQGEYVFYKAVSAQAQCVTCHSDTAVGGRIAILKIRGEMLKAANGNSMH